MRRPVLLIFTKNTCICFPQISYINMGYGCDFIRVHLFTTKITLTHYNHIWYCRVPGHLPHTDGSLRSSPPTAPAPRSLTPPPKPIISIYKFKSVLISSYYALIEALISQRDVSKGMGLLDFAAQLRISTKMTNNERG
jgi:hypothetical protein